jgi:hypothetical protein
MERNSIMAICVVIICLYPVLFAYIKPLPNSVICCHVHIVRLTRLSGGLLAIEPRLFVCY